MMLFMPLIFMGMFISAPSGLVLYWTVSNLWAIGQQVLTNRLIGPPPQHNVRPPAERQLKSAGGGQDARREGAEVMDVHGRVKEFVGRTLDAMGVPLEVAIEDTPDSVRLDLSGEGGEVLLQRRGETLDALQHIVNTAFRRELDGDRSFVVDCLGYRKSKDAELQQMTRFRWRGRRRPARRRRWDPSIRTPAAWCTSPSRKIRR